jgi:O-methyltransferase
MTGNLLNKIIRKTGYSIQKDIETQPIEKRYPDFEKEAMEILNQCKPYTMTSFDRLYSLYKAIEYISSARIEGDIVECGVWKGGSSMCAMLSLIKNKQTNRTFYLYDTFEGMSQPTEKDKSLFNTTAESEMASSSKEDQESVWCYAPIDEVKQNVASTGYDLNKIKLIKGKVEETIPGTIPDKISILRLDTDWYESTYHELVHLFPRLVKGGVLIIDDYGHWQGAREAVDTYLKENNIQILLNRIDYTGRIGIR